MKKIAPTNSPWHYKPVDQSGSFNGPQSTRFVIFVSPLGSTGPTYDRTGELSGWHTGAHPIAWVESTALRTSEQAQADAAFIVKAVNMYDDLAEFVFAVNQCNAGGLAALRPAARELLRRMSE